MPSIFDDILERAEKLHADANLGSISEFPTFSHSDKNNAVPSLKFDTGLSDIFRQSEEMWKQKSLKKDVNSSLAALKFSKNVNQLRTTSLNNSKTNESKSTCFDENALNAGTTAGNTPYDEYSSKEIERYVESSFERARIESERTFFNQQLIDQVDLPIGTNHGAQISNDPFSQLARGTPIVPGSNLNQPLAYLENTFAKKIDIALYKNCKVIIKDALKESVDEVNEKEVINIWRKVFAICSRSLIEDSESVFDLRSSRKWFEHVTESSTSFLHECFNEYMETIVENSLKVAQRGGIPGTIPLVEAYLNVKKIFYPGIEDGNYSMHPIWVVLFCCLKAGDLEAVGQVSKKLLNVSRCSILVGVLVNLFKTNRVDPEIKIKLSAEWRQCSSLCQDIYKKAVYGVFLGFDCPEVNNTIEDWLWARLMYCKLHSKDLNTSFRNLQNIVCIEFGENYFVHNGGSFIIYYAALMLTGQLEQAIVALFRSKLLVHAVHLSILAYQLKLLIISDKVSSEILVADVHNPTICQINFARIVLLYIKNFELTNINYALNYSFFLNKLELDAAIDDKGGRNVFKSCVSRIVYLTGERDQILGKLNAQGERVSGLIDKFSNSFSVSEVISYVAADTQHCGDTLEACKLYALAERSNEAIKLTCRQMSLCISAAAKNSVSTKNDSSLAENVDFAQWLVKRYRTRTNEPRLEKHNLSTLCLLIDLHTFFERIVDQKYEASLRVIKGLQFIPLSPDEVQTYVNTFEMVPEEVRLLLPEICTSLMKAIVSLHEKASSDSQYRSTLAAQAKSLILYTAMVPYRFPVSTNSLLLQLQAKIA